MIDRQQVTAVILAGGRGRRMGGQDKGLVFWQGRPLIEWAINSLQAQAHSIIISANRSLEQYRRYGYPVVRDQWPDYAGPLAGIASALQRVQTPYLICQPCDMPLLPPDWAQRLKQAWRPDIQIAVVDEGRRLQPLLNLMRADLAASIQNYLQSGGHRMHDWLYQQAWLGVDYSDQASYLQNLNTLDQLAFSSKNCQRS